MKIELTNGGFAQIDDQDASLVSAFKWRSVSKPPAKTKYVVACGNSGLSMHALIMGKVDGLQIDHRDGDGLNNTRSNLRHCTKSQNVANSKLPRSNTSGFKGVHMDSKGLWRAEITVRGKRLKLGCRKDKMAAVKLYDDAAIAHFGEFACTNEMLKKEAV